MGIGSGGFGIKDVKCAYLREAQYCGLAIDAPGTEHRAWEIRMVDGVGIKLRFEADCAALLILCAALARARRKEVRRVELHAGRRGQDGHDDAAAVAGQDCGFTQARPGEAEIVVIAVCMQAARIRSGQIAAQGFWRREVNFVPATGASTPVGISPGVRSVTASAKI